ncbi:MAG TPA: serine/threonine-protein kinase [Terriglobia bacterium]|nr:serine/threonine-protein kinase [Terriglobia bacterium]
MAIWRAVKCGHCGALIHKTESFVTRDSFRQALVRMRRDPGVAFTGIQCRGDRYQLVQLLGTGDLSQVYLARRIGAMPFLAAIKLSSSPAAAARHAREARVLGELQAPLGGAAGAYASLRLPEVVAEGPVEGTGTEHALVLRHPNGYWGSLADLNARFPHGLDPRHVVWIWRRMLDVLHFVHVQGWSHGDIRPEHALVHPADHGVRLISWASAEKDADIDRQAMDLVRSARVALVMACGAGDASTIPGAVPAGLATLLTRASQDQAFCKAQRAEGLDTLLREAAKEAYGPPSFVPLSI